MPIIRLGGPEVINIDFDELSHTYHRFRYELIHLEADFTESDGLFPSDYMQGTSYLTIEDNDESINTYQLYTHYSLQIPNPECRITMSGNYRLDIYDDNGDSDTPVMKIFFMVFEDRVPISLSYSDNTLCNGSSLIWKKDFPPYIRIPWHTGTCLLKVYAEILPDLSYKAVFQIFFLNGYHPSYT